ncbi:MAG: Gfo/Idh/MocA family oxidoreductase [Patescibacteria group bacterium]
MKNDFKIVIFGFGSIGKRHYKNLLSLGIEEENISIYDPAIKEYEKLPNLKNYNIVFVCSPNNFHVEQSLLAAKAGCHLFIEKPLSHNSKNIKKLINTCKKKKLTNMVACNFRFHPVIKKMKTLLDQNILGKIYATHHEGAYYLPYCRPGQDYTKNYIAKKETGGGAILDAWQQFDLSFWLNNFSEIKKSYLISDKVSNLKIKTEDMFTTIFQFKNKRIASIRGDCLQKSYSLNCKVVGEKGNLEWNFKKGIIWLKTKDKEKKLFEVKNYDLNKMYIDETKYFLNCVRKKQETFNGIEKAFVILKTILQ